MGRPSRIGLAFRVENGELVAATIGGSAVMVAEGVLDL
jgi:trans-2,3-dihydro-3-hydroxyanthranilate isomerase